MTTILWPVERSGRRGKDDWPKVAREVRPLQVMFVCTANISRSPYAERRALTEWSGAPVLVSSAGMPGFPDRPMDPEMARELHQRGADSAGHVSRALTDELITEADVLLTFEFDQHMRILERWPQHAVKVFGLTQFAGVASRLGSLATGPALLAEAYAIADRDSMSGDVDDPYRRGRRAARRAATQIDGLITRITPAWKGLSAAADLG